MPVVSSCRHLSRDTDTGVAKPGPVCLCPAGQAGLGLAPLDCSSQEPQSRAWGGQGTLAL